MQQMYDSVQTLDKIKDKKSQIKKYISQFKVNSKMATWVVDIILNQVNKDTCDMSYDHFCQHIHYLCKETDVKKWIEHLFRLYSD